jgi:hypothetical protein
VHAASATMTKYPEDCTRACMLTPAPFASSVPPGMVVPLGSVPFSRMVLVPFTSATLTSERFRLAYDPSPIRESRNVVLSLSSQPHSAYAAQRQVTGFVCSNPEGVSWRDTRAAQIPRRPFVDLLVEPGAVVFVPLVLDVSLALPEWLKNV